MSKYVEINHPIAALATPRLTSALALIRVSGKNSIALLSQLVRHPKEGESSQWLAEWTANSTRHVILQHPTSKEKIDEAMLTLYNAPRSYTGQEAADICIHGGLVGIDLVLSALYECGFEAAEPGEFTKRAFLSQKLDLTQAEAIHSIITAHSAESHALALAQLSGSVSTYIDKIKHELTEIAAICSVWLDYPDDEVQESTEIDITRISKLIKNINASIKSYDMHRLHREGSITILAGLTNAGKSSLFNSLLKEERSIVSDTHGTTRDYIESQLQLRGIPIRLYDTAGLRQAEEQIEHMGIQRSYHLIESADLLIYTIDSTLGVSQNDISELQYIIQTNPDIVDKIIIVWNKTDIPESKLKPTTIKINDTCSLTNIVDLSATRFENISALHDAMYNTISSQLQNITEDYSVINSLRQQLHLKDCLNSLLHVEEGLQQSIPLDMISLDIQTALNALGQITGLVNNEDILDIMFKNFCLGK